MSRPPQAVESHALKSKQAPFASVRLPEAGNEPQQLVFRC